MVWPIGIPAETCLCVIVENKHLDLGDRERFFSWGDEVFIINEQVDIFDLLVKLKAFTSKSQARKNWKGPKIIPLGWSEFIIGKKKLSLFIWNPIPFNREWDCSWGVIQPFEW